MEFRVVPCIRKYNPIFVFGMNLPKQSTISCRYCESRVFPVFIHVTVFIPLGHGNCGNAVGHVVSYNIADSDIKSFVLGCVIMYCEVECIFVNPVRFLAVGKSRVFPSSVFVFRRVDTFIISCVCSLSFLFRLCCTSYTMAPKRRRRASSRKGAKKGGTVAAG